MNLSKLWVKGTVTRDKAYATVLKDRQEKAEERLQLQKWVAACSAKNEERRMQEDAGE
jgi:hypothetical protein